MRDPLGRLFPRLPREVRVALDWVLTIAGAVVIVLALKMWVVNPYRIPSSSMEPTLHCAKPGLGCEAPGASSTGPTASSRTASSTASAIPKRGEIIVFKTPPEAQVRCGAGGTFVKRLIGLPGEVVSERDGFVYINGAQLQEPYIKPDRRDHEPPRTLAADPEGRLLLHGRQPRGVLRFAGLGAGAAQEPDRRGVLRLLAADPTGFSLIWPLGPPGLFFV